MLNWIDFISTRQWIGMIVLIGIVFRLYNLEVTGLWIDEIHSAVGASPYKTIGEVFEYCKTDQPPFFFALLHDWYKIFGYNDFGGRFFVVITGLLGIIAAYFLGKQCKNERVGLMAAFLTSINYFHIDSSRQVRFYPLVFLLSALSYLFFLKVFKDKKNRSYFFYFLSTALLLNTHYFGIVVFASQLIIFAFLIFMGKFDIRFVIKSLFVGVLVAISFVHWLPVVVSDLGISSFHAQQVSWYFPVSFYWVYFRDVITCAITGILLLRVFRNADFKANVSQDISVTVTLVGWIFFGFLIPLIYSLVRMPMLEYKYSIIVLPALFVLIAVGFDAIESRVVRLAIPPVLAICFLVNSVFFESIYFREPFERWREITKEIGRTSSSEEIVFSDYAWYLRYYFTIYSVSNQPLEQRFADFQQHLKQSKKIWVIKSLRYPDAGLTTDQQRMLEQYFTFDREVKYPDMTAKHYVRR